MHPVGCHDDIYMKHTSQESILNSMRASGLVPVFNHEDIEVAKKVLDACYKAGVRVFEFTNRSSNAIDVFGQLIKHAEQYEDLIIGIGTIFTTKQAGAFMDKGAAFVVSPVMLPELGTFCIENNIPWFPGCGTVTEIYRAKESGAVMVTIFPGNVLGPGFVKSAKAVFPDLAMMPTGGVAPTEDNLKAWFDAGVTCVGMGSKLIRKEGIANNDFRGLENTVGNTIDIIRNIRK